MTRIWTAYTDGASRGNPGPAAAGVYVVSPEGREFKHKQFLGEQTNNFAEYTAMILALKGLMKARAKNIVIKADSQLMIRQMRGEYKVKNENIKTLFEQARSCLPNFESVRFEHIPREDNKIADALANEALDEQKSI